MLASLWLHMPGSGTHSGFNSPSAPLPVPPTSPVTPTSPVPPTSPVFNKTGVPGDGEMQLHSSYPVINEAIVHNHPDLAQVLLVNRPSQFGSRNPSTSKMSPPSIQCSTTSQVLNPEMPGSNDHTSLKTRDNLQQYIIGPEVQQTVTQTAKLCADIQNCSTSGAATESHKTRITDVNNSDTVKDICRQSTSSLNPSRSAAIVVNLTNLQTAENEQDGTEVKG